MPQLLCRKLPCVSIQTVEYFVNDRSFHNVDHLHGDLIVPELLLKSLFALQIAPFFSIESDIAEVVGDPDSIIHEVEDGLRALFSIDDVIGRFPGFVDGLVQEDRRAREISENRIEEKLPILPRPDT